MTTHLLTITAITTGALLLAAALLHLLPKLGRFGRTISESLCRAPWLDGVMTYFTVLPMAVGAIIGAWTGLAAAVVGQVIALFIWVQLHELTHPAARKGPRLVHALNRSVGRWRNHAALWVTALAIPLFWCVRVIELTVYPPLTLLIRLPRYKDREWVNLSRHKFEGLVGHDLIWCLYCDWMTGIWSLGSEMLRNIESFWCPIRFDDDKKCDHCQIDFPDVKNEWVPADSSMAQAVQLIEQKHAEGNHAWFGHPGRVTIEGKSQQDPETKP